MKLKTDYCPTCQKLVTVKNMQRHIDTHTNGKSVNSENHIKAIINGRKNTTPCINHQRSRSTLISLDGMPFKSFSAVKIGDMNEAIEIRACGKEFSLYQEERTYDNRHKIVWIDEAEHGNPSYVPQNILDRAIKAGVDI